jgi:hypothetical protein
VFLLIFLLSSAYNCHAFSTVSSPVSEEMLMVYGLSEELLMVYGLLVCTNLVHLLTGGAFALSFDFYFPQRHENTRAAEDTGTELASMMNRPAPQRRDFTSSVPAAYAAAYQTADDDEIQSV